MSTMTNIPISTVHQGIFTDTLLVYIGQRRIRHSSEPNLKQEELLQVCPEAVPHVFVDYAGARLARILQHAGGKQGCVVDVQKIVRDQSTMAEVTAWRAQFGPEYFSTKENNMVFFGGRVEGKRRDADYIREAVLFDIVEGAPAVVLPFTTSGSALDVPMQPEDMLRLVREKAPILFEGLFHGLSEEEQLEKVADIADELQAIMEQ